MKKLIVSVRPFLFKQVITIVDDEAKTAENLIVKTGELPDTISKLCKEKSIKDIEIKGSAKFNKKIEENIKEIATKYELADELNIKFI